VPHTHIATFFSTSRQNVAKVYQQTLNDFRVKFLIAGAWVQMLDGFTGTSAEAFEVAEESLAIQDGHDARSAKSEEIGRALVGHVQAMQTLRPAASTGSHP
jgi:hypothetical protein